MSSPAVGTPPVQDRFALWGGVATVASVSPAALPAARAAVERTVEAFDRACSSYRRDSELSVVNRMAGTEVEISPLFGDAIATALWAAETTDGDVDPTVGQALAVHGRFAGEPSDRPLRTEAVPGIAAVGFDRARGTVSVARGVLLDLGATAKALAADRAATAAHAAAGCGVIVSLLGDLAIAGEPPAEGWSVRVTDDHRHGHAGRGQTVALRSGGLATSSTTVRSREGAHHLIDPRSGRPARTVIRTASVAADSCVDANVASTAAIVRGREAPDWLRRRGLASRLVLVGGEALHLADWPAAGDDLPTGEPW